MIERQIVTASQEQISGRIVDVNAYGTEVWQVGVQIATAGVRLGGVLQDAAHTGVVDVAQFEKTLAALDIALADLGLSIVRKDTKTRMSEKGDKNGKSK